MQSLHVRELGSLLQRHKHDQRDQSVILWINCNMVGVWGGAYKGELYWKEHDYGGACMVEN